MTDIKVEHHGSIVLLCPRNLGAGNWLREHVDPAALRYFDAFVVEPRYVADIVQGARDDGLEVA